VCTLTRPDTIYSTHWRDKRDGDGPGPSVPNLPAVLQGEGCRRPLFSPPCRSLSPLREGAPPRAEPAAFSRENMVSEQG